MDGGSSADPEAKSTSWRASWDSARSNGRTEYKVHWAGYDADEDSWEPESSSSDLAALDAWQAQQPQPRRSTAHRSRAAAAGSVLPTTTR